MKDQSLIYQLTQQFDGGSQSIVDFLINIFLTIIISYIIGLAYTKYGSSLSNREKLSHTLVIISIVVMLIISIVKTSLALSLGLVGALSIVRFRTAIKEPEELVYFFIAIAIGLGLGANQKMVTIIGSSVILLYIIFANKNSSEKMVYQNLILTISKINEGSKINEENIIDLLRDYCTDINLKRLDDVNSETELALAVRFKDLKSLLEAKNSLKKLGEIKFSFIENI